ncbi:eCIS core domain-containing protein [Streptomyces spiralis]|uniref:eCIS core domain-containing protein n=1 Tax=Streptomyces spiralis TaxID=66376 RepID=UPI003570D91E
MVVQRSTAFDVLRGSGKPLPEPVRHEMEARLGADFMSVRIHDDAMASRSAAELGARAYTSGEHVVIGSGGGDRHTLAHELTHVIQQRQGPVSGTDNGAGLSVSDPTDRFERAAEENARRSLAGPVPSTAPEGHAAGHAHVSAQRAPAHRATPEPAVQRALLVGQTDYTKIYKDQTKKVPPQHHEAVLNNLTNDVFNAFYKKAAPEFEPHERGMFTREQDRILWQLKKAIVAPIGYQGYHPVLKRHIGTHPDFGTKNHDIKVNDYTELAYNLMGWVYAKDNRRKEKVAAKEIQKERNVEVLLNVLIKRINSMAQGFKMEMSEAQASRMDRELETGLSDLLSQPSKTDEHGNFFPHDPDKANKPVGSYIDWFWFKGNFGPHNKPHLRSSIIPKGGFLELMRNPEKFSFRDKMIALHDLSEFFGYSKHTPGTAGKFLVDEPGEDEVLSTTAVDRDGNRKEAKEDRGQMKLKSPPPNVRAHQPSTRNEYSPTTILARERNLPVWAGQSYTAARMFKMAHQAGASQEEIAAVAWGIFSFWRINFDHTTEFAYHTLHEVMDIGQNFGVPYNINEPYGSKAFTDISRLRRLVIKLHDTAYAQYNMANTDVSTMKQYLGHADRMDLDRDQEAQFLLIAESVKSEAFGIWEGVGKRIDKFKEWEKGRLGERQQTQLVKDVIDGVEVTVKLLQHLTEKLEIHRPEV